MTHVTDDLELYAVGALPPQGSRLVAEHLRGCEECRAAADDLAAVVATLPDALPPREPPAGLGRRILAAAAADLPGRPRRRTPLAWDRRALALAAAFALLLAFGAGQTLRVRQAQAEADRYAALAESYAHGGRTWYMAGVGQWAGMGGNLVKPASGEPAFVLFHDLRPLAQGQVYALWLISSDGKWIRGTSFAATGDELQAVAVGQELAGYERCAVTVEASPDGRREGPVVMQSRIAPPAPSP